MNDYTSFIEVIQEFLQLFDILIPVEQKKLDAAMEKKISHLEECINQEQAAVLRLRGLEQKRQTVQKEMGAEDSTFRQIVEEAPADVKDNLRTLFEELNEKIHTFQSISDSAKDMIEVNLHVIRSALEAESANSTYSSTGNKTEHSGTHFTTRSV